MRHLPVRKPPANARELVEALPRRTAHVAHALIESSRDRGMPVTAAEVILYDPEALTTRHTAAALREAARKGLALYDGRYWMPSFDALDLRTRLEDRFLADTERDSDG